jgi:mannose-6-phosphate isomerase-like protein (cupin superfamily)
MTDQERILHRVESETYGAFRVTQITRGTALEDLLGLDLVTIPAGMKTEVHRHPHAEDVVYVLSGDATAIIDHVGYRVVGGDRLRIGKEVYHGFQTSGTPLTFVSVQSPPILNKKLNILDTEILEELSEDAVQRPPRRAARAKAPAARHSGRVGRQVWARLLSALLRALSGWPA